jgi:hypothetical protein
LVILGGRPGGGERAGNCPVGKPKYTGQGLHQTRCETPGAAPLGDVSRQP